MISTLQIGDWISQRLRKRYLEKPNLSASYLLFGFSSKVSNIRLAPNIT